MDYVINGEIFLKNGPQTFQIKPIQDKIDDLNYLIATEPIKPIWLKQLQEYEELYAKFVKYNNKIDYSGTTNFWQLEVSSGKFIMRQRRSLENMMSYEQEYQTIEELKRDFTPLRDFLNIAKFIGREFKRTAPTTTIDGKEDKSYMNLFSNSDKCIVLYACQDLFLARYEGWPDSSYRLINSRYTLDGKYQFFGPIKKEYEDKTRIYKEILEQIQGYSIKRDR